jgi:hypothetical protein
MGLSEKYTWWSGVASVEESIIGSHEFYPLFHFQNVTKIIEV